LSEVPVGWFESFFGWLGQALESTLPESLLRSLIVSGIIDGVGGVLGFVPLIGIMFLAIAVLEDSGYMARIAFMLDRLLRLFGLHGASVLALIVGGGIAGGCAVPAVMASRTLRDDKERLATIMAVPFMNCGAKLPVYAMLIAAFFGQYKAEMLFLLTLISWSLSLTSAWVLRHTVLKGTAAPFVMELPPYRLPTFKGLIIHAWERTWSYIRKAGTVILVISVIMWALMSFPGLRSEKEAEFQARRAVAIGDQAQAQVEAEESQARLASSLAGRLGHGLNYITAPLGFDWRTNVALVGGFAAKEVVLSTLATAYSVGQQDEEEYSLSEKLRREPSWNPLVAFGLIIFVMVYAPCFVTLSVIRKEAGIKWAAFSMLYSTAFAYVLVLIIYQMGRLFNLG
jgi:ferrous iron transport protein B